MPKTITISDEAYKALLREKRPNESFSATILRLVRSKTSLLDLAGAWKDADPKRLEGAFKELEEMWKRWSTRFSTRT